VQRAGRSSGTVGPAGVGGGGGLLTEEKQKRGQGSAGGGSVANKIIGAREPRPAELEPGRKRGRGWGREEGWAKVIVLQ
jgi:hypothetical protein